jgi:hypothetical protein
MVLCSSLPSIGHDDTDSLEDDFLLTYPAISIANLLQSNTDGIYIVGGVVEGLVNPYNWWNAACNCHTSLIPDSVAYYCNKCDIHVPKFIPRSLFINNLIFCFFL